MAAFSFTNGVAIAILIYYVIFLPLTLLACARHGTAKASGWRYLLVFAVIRIIGSAAQLATISQGQNSTAATVAEVTSALGVSPLLLASLGFVSRLYDSVQDIQIGFLATRGIRIIQVACGAALVLCIIGATQGDLSALYNQTTIRAGVIIYMAVWIALALLVLLAASVVKGKYYEKPLLTGLGISLPILLVRICFSLYVCFGDKSLGSALANSTTREFLTLFLATLEEMVVMLIYASVGLLLAPLPKPTGASSVSIRGYA